MCLTRIVDCSKGTYNAYKKIYLSINTSTRLLVLGKLNELVNQWIYDISIEKGKSEAEARVTAGKICTFGSYRLGVHGKGADIDTLVIAPRHIERYDFFQSFKERLENCKEVKHLRVNHLKDKPTLRHALYAFRPLKMLLYQLLSLNLMELR